MEVVRAAFRPEFLNRLDEVILFNRLGRAQMKDIVDDPARRGCASCWPIGGMTLELTDARSNWLGNAGYDPVYGARPLKRVIQRAAAGPAGADASWKASWTRARPCQVDAGPTGC